MAAVMPAPQAVAVDVDKAHLSGDEDGGDGAASLGPAPARIGTAGSTRSQGTVRSTGTHAGRRRRRKRANSNATRDIEQGLSVVDENDSHYGAGAGAGAGVGVTPSVSGDAGSVTGSVGSVDKLAASTKRKLRPKSEKASITHVYNAEEIETLIMLSGLTAKEITKLYRKFYTYSTADAADGTPLMSKADFVTLPELEVNPLAERIAKVFGFDEVLDESIDFETFANGCAVFSERGFRDKKLRASFDIYDVDGDGKISRDDLAGILTLIVEIERMEAEELDELLQKAVNKTFEEACRHDPDANYITWADYNEVVGQNDDFAAKLNVFSL